MKWSLALVFIFVFSLFAPPVMPIAEEEEKPMVVACQHDNSAFDRPIGGDSEETDTEDEGEDAYVYHTRDILKSHVTKLFSSDLLHSYQSPALDRNIRPPRV